MDSVSRELIHTFGVSFLQAERKSSIHFFCGMVEVLPSLSQLIEEIVRANKELRLVVKSKKLGSGDAHF